MGPETHEWMFYEVMWRIEGRQRPLPLPWWVQQYFRNWENAFDSGLFDTREGAFASNASYRYWNMVGVKDAPQECLIGQAGEIEPVYDEYSMSFFLFDPATRELDFPQLVRGATAGPPLRQQLQNDYLPIIVTTWQSRFNLEVQETVFATTIGQDQRTAVFARMNLRRTGNAPAGLWFGISISPQGPTGFKRHDRAGRFFADRRLTFMQYLPAEQRVLINTSNGPLFSLPPASFGLCGNGNSFDPDFYLDQNPYTHLARDGALNGFQIAVDNIAGMCSGAFVWPMNLSASNARFALDVILPVDDFRGASDIALLRNANVDALAGANQTWWTNKLDGTGLQAMLPPQVAHLWNLFRTCRSNLLILADDGQIHPGPTIYDEFWIRDSSVEAIAGALVGDQNLAQRQLGFWHPSVFNFGGFADGVSLRGFFGGTHEKNDHEWDSNGQALWAFGRFDRVMGGAANFGRGLFTPYVLDGARWIRDNRSPFGLLPSGWSAEHIGDKDKPHYWDDFWGMAGLWEAARLAERIGAGEADEIWRAYDSLRDATANSIRWVLDQHRQRGLWETFIPTGPGDVGRLDSTIIGALCYFHPCRLYDGAKLGGDIDSALRATLETIWGHFMDGGFRHDSAWNCYGPYLTLQLAHAFLLLGDVERMDQCLQWLVGNAAYATVSRDNSPTPWQVVLGAWNEQHCYPIAKDFREMPNRPWYMGDIPHGWACAEFMTLIRDILFFEANEDADAQLYIAPGVMAHWLRDGEMIGVANAPTIFGTNFGYRLTHRANAGRVTIHINQAPPPHVRFIYACHFGSSVQSATADGNPVQFFGRDVQLPRGFTDAEIIYNP
jgi:hypothetical protein